ncbi:MAG TPA: anhydro-N-acetylmuramic acid kinase, partial [Polyangia bacterium]|nr:anhydro-N-acetylmuramic acid kinase [Polyangia bacterium]
MSAHPLAGDPFTRLLAARDRPGRLVIGLLSGTSADGTDAALCAIDGSDETTRLTVRAFVSTPFDRPLRERIFRLSQADASELCDLDVLLG